MEVGDWITLGAVIVALGIGVASILHTQSLQRKERREQLLNEIIEWAGEVILLLRKFKHPPVYSETYDHREVLNANKNYLVSATKDIIIKEQRFEKAFDHFDKLCEEKNHEDESFKKQAEQCRKSMYEILQAVGEYKSKL